ncbi:Ltp family lipoprotein [Staphylococcus simulans]|nr:Ltp family lipoprotein [Staphylococcus simulans]
MSDQRIYDQLVSPYGENFTEEEADYAMNNLNSNN